MPKNVSPKNLTGCNDHRSFIRAQIDYIINRTSGGETNNEKWKHTIFNFKQKTAAINEKKVDLEKKEIPALHDVGGSFCKSLSSFRIRFDAICETLISPDPKSASKIKTNHHNHNHNDQTHRAKNSTFQRRDRTWYRQSAKEKTTQRRRDRSTWRRGRRWSMTLNEIEGRRKEATFIYNAFLESTCTFSADWG